MTSPMHTRMLEPVRRLSNFRAQQAPANAVGGALIYSGTWEGQPIEYVDREVVVKPSLGKQAEAAAVYQQYGAALVEPYNVLGWGVIRIGSSYNALSVAAQLNASPTFEWAYPNAVVRGPVPPPGNGATSGAETQSSLLVPGTPNDPYFAGTPPASFAAMIGLDQSADRIDINAPEGWLLTNGGPSGSFDWAGKRGNLQKLRRSAVSDHTKCGKARSAGTSQE